MNTIQLVTQPATTYPKTPEEPPKTPEEPRIWYLMVMGWNLKLNHGCRAKVPMSEMLMKSVACILSVVTAAVEGSRESKRNPAFTRRISICNMCLTCS